MTQTQFDDIKAMLSTPQRIVIIPHRNPDGDAIGSSLALFHFLKMKQHDVTVVAPNDYPEFLKWLPGNDKVRYFDKQNKQSKKALSKASLIFLLDFNALHRIGEDMKNTVEKFEGIFVMIDHHLQPDTSVTDYIYSDPSICSTSQMIYHFLEKIDEVDKIDAGMATCMYAGIMTDTGSFRFPSTTSTTHRIIANLIDCGAKNAEIHNNIYDTNSYGRIQLLGKALSNLKVEMDYRTAYITLAQDELDQFNFQKGDTEGVVNYALSLEKIVFAAIFIEDVEQKIIKISFRSKGSFSVNQFARDHFNGGGHDNAAGGRSEKTLEETVNYFLKLIPNYKLALEKSDEV